VFVFIALDFCDGTLVAFIGAIAGFFLVTGLRTMPSSSTVFSWVDWSSITLLAMMMLVNNVYTTTGVFEWLSYRILLFCRGRVYLLYFLLNLFSMFVAAILPNVTAVLLLAPVVLQMAKARFSTPIPFSSPSRFGDRGNAFISNPHIDDFNCVHTALLPGRASRFHQSLSSFRSSSSRHSAAA